MVFCSPTKKHKSTGYHYSIQTKRLWKPTDWMVAGSDIMEGDTSCGLGGLFMQPFHPCLLWSLHFREPQRKPCFLKRLRRWIWHKNSPLFVFTRQRERDYNTFRLEESLRLSIISNSGLCAGLGDFVKVFNDCFIHGANLLVVKREGFTMFWKQPRGGVVVFDQRNINKNWVKPFLRTYFDRPVEEGPSEMDSSN